ncbi:putative inactive receptor kinase At4g23740 [Wolffia australiana]
MEVAIAFLLAVLLGGAAVPPAAAEPRQDRLALLDFIRGIRHSRALNWDPSTPACNNWIGVTCDEDESRVVALRLPAVGLTGPIPPNTLSRLSALKTLSLRSNSISGPFPPDFSLLSSLTELHLHQNALSGPLPRNFSQWRNLTAVNLSFNAFNGTIPPSISDCAGLEILKLSNNSLAGQIPDLRLPSLIVLDLSNNALQGTVPPSLRRFPASSFLGNSLTSSEGPSSAPSEASSEKRGGLYLSQAAVIGLILGVLAVLVLLGVFFCRRKEPAKTGSPEKAVAMEEEKSNRLAFFEGGSVGFDLEDLLRASAEVLGKGSLGSAYKASLEDSTTVVVKRLKQITAGKKEFEQQMDLLGRIRHENVAPPRAYFFSKDEKLVIYDYSPGGSLFSLLHGEKGSAADWETRVRVAAAAAKGLAHVHEHNGGKMVHGNVKSTNVLLDGAGARVADAGLACLGSAPRGRGYSAPELAEPRRATQASDVYSFGVLLLELLTGKNPGSAEGANLVRWVQSVVREEWTAEVFDGELVRCADREGEMVELLRIAMACVARSPDKRPAMAELVEHIHGLRRPA